MTLYQDLSYSVSRQVANKESRNTIDEKNDGH